MTKEEIPPCFIFIDKEGRWFHDGLEMIHREIIQLFYQNMQRNSQGRYVIHLGGQKCYVDVEDTAWVVRRVEFESREQGHQRFLIWLNDDTQEVLNSDTLLVGKNNVLYCQVKEGRFPARFQRAAYYQLADHVEEENHQYFLRLNGEKHFIHQIH